MKDRNYRYFKGIEQQSNYSRFYFDLKKNTHCILQGQGTMVLRKNTSMQWFWYFSYYLVVKHLRNVKLKIYYQQKKVFTVQIANQKIIFEIQNCNFKIISSENDIGCSLNHFIILFNV